MDESQNNYAEWKKLGKKDYKLYNSIYINPTKCKLISSDRNRPVICRGTCMGKASMKRARKRGFTEAQEDTFGDNVYNYLDCGDGFITLNI